mgnify:FL=1
MKRVIVDFKRLNNDILELLVEKFPYGYDETDIITFRNANYELIEAVEIKTDNTIYLVKISKRLADSMENFEPDNEDDSEDKMDESDKLSISSDDSMENDFDQNL